MENTDSISMISLFIDSILLGEEMGDTGLEPVTSCMSSKHSNQTELIALETPTIIESDGLRQVLIIIKLTSGSLMPSKS